MKLTKTLLISALVGSLAGRPALASEIAPALTLQQSQVDISHQMLFEQDGQPLQLAVLSQNEMQETNGQFIIFMAAAFGLLLLVGSLANDQNNQDSRGGPRGAAHAQNQSKSQSTFQSSNPRAPR